MTDVLHWLAAFAVTCAIELAIAVPMLRAVEASVARRVVLCVFANLATHPAVWFVFPRLGLPGSATIALAELWAFGLEAVFYAFAFPAAGATRATTISLVANAASFGAGLVLTALYIL